MTTRWTLEKEQELRKLYQDWKKSKPMPLDLFCQGICSKFGANSKAVKAKIQKLKYISVIEQSHIDFLGADKKVPYAKFLEFHDNFFQNEHLSVSRNFLKKFGYDVEKFHEKPKPKKEIKPRIPKPKTTAKQPIIIPKKKGKRNIYFDIAEKIGAIYNEFTGTITINGQPVCQSVITKARNEVLYG